jgi:hypothetical protein
MCYRSPAASDTTPFVPARRDATRRNLRSWEALRRDLALFGVRFGETDLRRQAAIHVAAFAVFG